MGATMTDDVPTLELHAGATAVESTRIRATGMPHLEIFQGTANEGEILVACQCPIGQDHSYADGMKYLGPVEKRR
ncbi:MAG: hypothetical protein JWN80_268 [Microbacteriaceae bacterium]|jgi:hypothetical protein|nr:hypothetical protein [Microbacteriaceae bacterium]